MSIQSKLSLDVSNCSGLQIQEGEQALISSSNKANYSSLPSGIHPRIFVFLSVSEISQCSVNRQMRDPIQSTYLCREKVRQIDSILCDRLSALANVGVQVNWRQHFQQTVRLNNLSRRVTHVGVQLGQLEIAQRPITQRSRDNFVRSIEASKCVVATFCLLTPAILPAGAGAIASISAYAP